jgi:cobalt-precorrin 5A hydrolase
LHHIAIVTINQPSLDSAYRLHLYLSDYQIDVYAKRGLKHNFEMLFCYDKLDDILPSLWQEFPEGERYYDAVIFIVAVGAVVRKIAPFLKDKTKDPAILVMNLALDRVVPLVGGHLGGANAFSYVITSRIEGCINFISTATDQTNTLSFEMLAQKRDWIIANIKPLAKISNRLINKQEVKVATYPNIFDSIPNKENLKFIDFNEIDTNSVVIAPTTPVKDVLWLSPLVYLGIGCNRDTSLSTIEKAFELFLEKNSLSRFQIKAIASFEAKKDEVGLLEFAKKYNYPITFYKKDDINALQNEFSKSASTKFFGIKGVAEPCSLLLSDYKELIFKKEVYFNSVTIAGAL